MKKLIFTFVVVLSACTTNEVFQTDAVRIDMASLNKGLRGYLLRNVMKNNISSLTEEKYLIFVKERVAPSEKEYVYFLEEYKPEMKLRASKKDFAICLKAVRVKAVICDIANTGMTDFDSNDVTIDLSTKIKELKLAE